ncbi:MAG: c-type cytochrome, partial [Burkholderiales bacterium]
MSKFAVQSPYARRKFLAGPAGLSAWLAAILASAPVLAASDVERGARAFGACAACHTLEPGRHLTGPSLAGIWGRKAGAT